MFIMILMIIALC